MECCCLQFMSHLVTIFVTAVVHLNAFKFTDKIYTEHFKIFLLCTEDTHVWFSTQMVAIHTDFWLRSPFFWYVTVVTEWLVPYVVRQCNDLGFKVDHCYSSRWDHYIVSKEWVPIIQWHIATYQKNGYLN